MKKFLTLVTGIALMAGFTFAGLTVAEPSVAQAASNGSSGRNVLYVDASNTHAGNGTKANPFSKIQDAINAAKDHSTVVVQTGTYHESVSIAKSIQLQAATSDVVVDAGSFDNGITVEGAGAKGSSVQGFKVENAGIHAIWIHDTANVSVTNNIVTANGRNKVEGKPLTLEGTSETVVSDNEIYENFGGGVSVLDDVSFPAVHNRIVRNNIHDNTQGGCGIVVSSNIPGQGVLHNEVDGNMVARGVAGIVVAANPPGTSAIDNIVIHNQVSNNLLPGIIVHSNAPDQSVTGTKIIGNTLDGNGIIGDPEVGLIGKTGIALIGAVNPVQKTTIAENTITNAVYGIWISNDDSTVIASSNKITAGVPVFKAQ